MKISQKYLSEELSQKLRNLPETGMGYQICSVVLNDGRTFEKVYVLNGNEIASINGRTDIPFGADQIENIVVTHDKSLS